MGRVRMVARTVALVASGLASLAVVVPAAPSVAGTAAEAATPAERTLRIQDLGTLGGTNSEATDINDRGEVVGHSERADHRHHAFLWRRGRMIDLGTLPGHDQSAAAAINEHGVVVGYSQAHSEPARAVMWVDGTIHDLGIDAGEGIGSYASDVNNRGVVIGELDNAGISTAFRWHRGVRTDLPTPPPVGVLTSVRARGLNEAGDVVGQAQEAGTCGACSAVLWRRGRTPTRLPALPAGPPGGYGFDINERRQVVGLAPTDGGLATHAVMWDRTGIVDLGTLGGSDSEALAVNDRGQVVGVATTGPGYPRLTLAFLWEDGHMRPLEQLGPGLTSLANGINNRGQVVGWSDTADEEEGSHAVLWG